MTTVSDSPAATTKVRPTRPSDVIVPLFLIVAELILGWFSVDIGRAFVEHLGTARSVQWLYLALPSLLLALVVALHALRPRRAPAAALVALGAAAATIAEVEAIRWIFTHHPDTNHHVYQTIGYVGSMTVATLAALAWGVSRRHGKAWLVGVLVAPAGAALTLWTNWPAHVGWSRFASPTDTIGIRRADLVHYVALVLPVLAACAVCWLIDATELRRGDAHRPPPR
jgi:hypothetical protein